MNSKSGCDWLPTRKLHFKTAFHLSSAHIKGFMEFSLFRNEQTAELFYVITTAIYTGLIF